jgi:hypothetical protein
VTTPSVLARLALALVVHGSGIAATYLRRVGGSAINAGGLLARRAARPH